MSSVYDDIRTALETHLVGVSGIPSDVAWENVKFSPTTDTPYLKVRLVPTTRRPATRGSNPQQRYEGFFRVLVYVPESEGPINADDYADTILAAFDATTDLNYNGTYVTVEYAERSQGIESSPWYYVPVEIGWYSYKQ